MLAFHCTTVLLPHFVSITKGRFQICAVHRDKGWSANSFQVNNRLNNEKDFQGKKARKIGSNPTSEKTRNFPRFYLTRNIKGCILAQRFTDTPHRPFFFATVSTNGHHYKKVGLPFFGRSRLQKTKSNTLIFSCASRGQVSVEFQFKGSVLF